MELEQLQVHKQKTKQNRDLDLVLTPDIKANFKWIIVICVKLCNF